MKNYQNLLPAVGIVVIVKHIINDNMSYIKLGELPITTFIIVGIVIIFGIVKHIINDNMSYIKFLNSPICLILNFLILQYVLY